MKPAPGAAGGPLGYLGGSFDPVHLGHLQLARDAERALGLESLSFVPAGQPWQKPGRAPAARRLEMLELALAEEPRWHIDRRELDRAGPTYTVDTARALRAQAGPARPLVWILGQDQLERLPTWHRWEELLELMHFAVAARAGLPPGADAPPAALAARFAAPGELAGAPAGRLARFHMRPVDCSATAIRRALRAGDVAYAARWLPPAVLDYLRRQPLYTEENGDEEAATPGD
jgi:nicotinate-nucleotide adenylyltransferase